MCENELTSNLFSDTFIDSFISVQEDRTPPPGNYKGVCPDERAHCAAILSKEFLIARKSFLAIYFHHQQTFMGKQRFGPVSETKNLSYDP